MNSHLWLALIATCWLSLCLFTNARAQNAKHPEVGYLEGRIISLERTPPAHATATPTAKVELSSGGTITATLPQALPGNPPDTVPKFREGDLVELYVSPSPEGQRRYVVSDWIRRPALLWLAFSWPSPV